MLGRRGLDLVGHAVEALVEQGAQAPAGAVAAEHIEVVDMHRAVAVRVTHRGRIHVGEPVVGDDLARHVEDQAAERVALVGVGVDAPVGTREVLVDRTGDVDVGLAVAAGLAALLAVDDVGACGAKVVGRDQALLHDVLDLLDGGGGTLKAVGDDFAHLARNDDGLVGAKLARGLAGLLDGGRDLGLVKAGERTVTLDD